MKAHLIEAIQDTGDQQYMPILDGADVNKHQVGALGDRCTGRVGQTARGGGIELEQDLLLQSLLEVEFAFIKCLVHLDATPAIRHVKFTLE